MTIGRARIGSPKCRDCDWYAPHFSEHGYCDQHVNVLGETRLVSAHDSCDDGENDDVGRYGDVDDGDGE